MSQCACFNQFSQFKTHFAAGGAAVTLAGYLFVSSRSKAQRQREKEFNEKIKALEDEQLRLTTQGNRFAKDLKLAQSTILGQEATIRKLTESLTTVGNDLSAAEKRLSSAIEITGSKTESLAAVTERELAQQRRRLADVAALKAETDARFVMFEKKVKQCHEVPTPALVVAAPAVASDAQPPQTAEVALSGSPNA